VKPGVRILGVMDEADMVMQARSIDGHQNAGVSVVLRELEYNQGIMFLTTTRVRDLDDANLSRINLAVSYELLSLATSFLKKAVTANGAAYVIPKTSRDWRGRISMVSRLEFHFRIQSINTDRVVHRRSTTWSAHALAVYHNTKVSMPHLELFSGLSEEFDSDFGGAG
jgi:hypothetical protein